jgi:hypothetical protein
MTRVRSSTVLPLAMILILAGTFVIGSTNAAPPEDQVLLCGRLDAPDRQDCWVGHGSEMMFSWDSLTAQGGYKYLFHPTETCDCPTGFHLDSIHIWLVFSNDDVPVTFDVYGDLEQAMWNEETQCWEPGPELCVSQTYTITIEYGGWNAIEIPMYDECECVCMDAWYFLSVHFPEPVPEAVLGLGDAVDDCVAYLNTGSGWMDWNEAFPTVGGCFDLHGGAYCCDSPSPTRGGTWGDIKGLFRR